MTFIHKVKIVLRPCEILRIIMYKLHEKCLDIIILSNKVDLALPTNRLKEMEWLI